MLFTNTMAAIVGADTNNSGKGQNGFFDRQTSQRPKARKQLIKTLRVMKLTAIILLAACLQLSAKSNAQIKITLSMRDAPLEKVLRAIEKQGGYIVWCEKSLLEHTTPITLEMLNVPLEQAMIEILRDQPLKFTIIGRTIVISQKETITVNKIIHQIDVLEGRVVNEKGDPVVGATVFIKGTSKGTNTDEYGSFSLKEIPDDATIAITSVGYYDTTFNVAGRKSIYVQVRVKLTQLDQAVVTISTGYQQIPKERLTGSFVQINNELYNRRISSDVLTKLDGISSGVYFNGSGSFLNSDYTLPRTIRQPDPNNKVGITIRGQSTLSNLISKDPLIVLDNFPYEGDINNFDPNIVESITILKDAAAASIWGARAGNGVIVITTKKGKFNQKMKIDFNSNITAGAKPDLFKDRNFLSSSNYIDVEDTLFLKGFFNSDLANTTNFPVLSPVVEILSNQRNGLISSSDTRTQIDALRNLDIRNDYKKYIYQSSTNQQYAINLHGGGQNFSYNVAASYNALNSTLMKNDYNKININSLGIFVPVKNLEVTSGFVYSQVNLKADNSFPWGPLNGISIGGNKYFNIYPYTQFSDSKGKNLPLMKNYRPIYIDSVQNLGFLNWTYIPLDELNLADNTTKQNDVILNVGVKYKFNSSINAEVKFQNETQTSVNRIYYSPQSYYARNLVNQFSQYDFSTQAITYPVPLGGVLQLTPSGLVSNNLRIQANYNSNFSIRHIITAIAGAEARQIKGTIYYRTSYGYNDTYGTSNNNLDFYDYFLTNPNGSGYIPAPNGDYTTTTNRFVSYYVNVAYAFNDRYTISVSGRKDGSNIFGVKINDRITPLWSAGFVWNLSKERFYQVIWLPTLKFRGTYGYSGNVYNGSAFLTGYYGTAYPTGLPTFTVSSAPNPELRWEKIRNINIGLDFTIKNNIISGTLEYYEKNGKDLIQPAPLATSTGFNTYTANDASTRTRGFDISIITKNVNRKVKWTTNFLLSTIHDKVLKYDVPQTAGSIQKSAVSLLGKPLYGVFSYRWAGIDPSNGDPQGFLRKSVSKNYAAIINNFSPDSLVFNGSARPTVFGSLRNTISYHGFSFSFNIVYKMGYVFRRPSTSLNYSQIIFQGANSDFIKRWQKPGDEKTSSVPSVVYPANAKRNIFYQYSEILVEKGDQIRLQDISISYDFKPAKNIEYMQVYTYINNLGIIWRENKKGIDPDAVYALPTPRTFSFGLKVGL